MSSIRYQLLKKLSGFVERINGFSSREKAKQLQQSLGYCGEGVHWSTNFVVASPENVYLGKNVSIAQNAVFLASMADLRIGNYVMFGPNVTIVTGEHRTDMVGEYMRNITEDMKLPENDQEVVIEDDVWVGSNVTILKGTHIGRGSIIHAGSVVSGKIRPYTVYLGPKLKISRFNDEEIEQHEKMLLKKYGPQPDIATIGKA